MAVAWGCALRIGVQDSQHKRGVARDLFVYASSDFGTTWIWFARRTSVVEFPDGGPTPQDVLPYWADYMVGELAREPPLAPGFAASSRPATVCRVVDACGWPLRSLYCQQASLAVRDDGLDGFFYVPDSMHAPYNWEALPIRYGVKTSLSPWSPPLFKYHTFPRALPYRPIWPGFAVNTIFYAAILWLLIPGPFVLRRFIRQRRGICPACAYPMGETGVCTECGQDLPTRAAT